MDSAGPEATALAASAGLVLDGWQAEVLDVALGEAADGRWAAREVGLVVPRQNGKGAILEALILASLLLFDEKLILYSAHEFKTAQETFLRVKALIESNDDLSSRISKVHNAHGSEGIELTTGQRLRFVARSKGSGRGFSPQRIILDEALNLSSRAVAALLFSVSAQDNPQLWYTSSHPENVEEGQVLRRLMRRGRVGDESLAYVEFCASDTASHDDPGAWAAANPGFPHRISEDTIRTERGATEPEHFARERLGIVDLEDFGIERVIPLADWARCLDPRASRGDRVAYGVDVSPDGRSAAIAVSDGSFVLVAEHHPGTVWLVDKLKGLLAARPGKVFLDPRGPAGALLVDLAEAEVQVSQVTAGQHAQACGGLLAAVTADPPLLAHGGQPVLDAAVSGATRRPLGDAWAWNRRTAAADISALVAVTLARWGAAEVVPEAGFVSLDDFLDEE